MCRLPVIGNLFGFIYELGTRQYSRQYFVYVNTINGRRLWCSGWHAKRQIIDDMSTSLVSILPCILLINFTLTNLSMLDIV